MRAYQFLVEYDIRKTLEKYVPLVAPLAASQGMSDPEKAVQIIINMDPTLKGTHSVYWKWLLDHFVKREFRLEDALTIKELLTVYHGIKNRLPEKDRDIGRLSKADLQKVINDLQNPVSNHKQAIPTHKKFLNRKDIKVLYVGPYGILASPKTEEASRELGSGTSWCTAYTNRPTMFSYYASKAPLYVWIDRSGAKYQFHFYDDEDGIDNDQFMDSSDNPISEKDFSKFWSIPPLNKFLTPYINDLPMKYVPFHVRTPEYYATAIERNGNSLQYVPNELKTYELCLAAVNNSGEAIAYVPRSFKTPEMCLAAVSNNGYALRKVPKELITPELCIVAVNSNSHALKDVPDELKTPELCFASVSKNGSSLQYVPEKFRTRQMCEAAIKTNPVAFRYTPREFITQEMCNDSVKRNSWTINEIPKEFLTQQMCEYAVQKDPMLLKDVPKEMITAKMCYNAVRDNGFTISEVPEKFKTVDLCKEAVTRSPFSLIRIPPNFKTEQLCLLAIKNYTERGANVFYDNYMDDNGTIGGVKFFDMIPEREQTEEFARKAVLLNDQIIGEIPEHLLTPELCLLAIRNHGGYVLEFIPDDHKTSSVCLAAVKNEPSMISEVPEKLQSFVKSRLGMQ